MAVTVRARRRAPTPHQQPPAPRGAIRVRLPQHRQRGPRATSNSRVYTRLSRGKAQRCGPLQGPGCGAQRGRSRAESTPLSPLSRSGVDVVGKRQLEPLYEGLLSFLVPVPSLLVGTPVTVTLCTCAVTLCTCAVTLCTCAVTLQESCCNGASWVTESASGQAPSTPVFREKRSAPPPASPVEVGSRR